MMLNTVFMGTPELAVPALKTCARLSNCTLVITQPDRPAGRGKKLRPPPVKEAAQQLDLALWQPQTLRGAEADPRLQDADLFVVLAYGEMLRQPVLDLPRIDCINLHASILPKWRGASPLQAVLRAGETQTGVSVMRMVKALDAGPVYLTETIALDQESTLPQLHDAMAIAAAAALERFFAGIPHPEPMPQDQDQVTWCGKLTSDDGRIDWTASCVAIDRQVRAYVPVPGCWTTVAGERYRIHRLIHVDQPSFGQPGELLVKAQQCFVQAGDGVLELRRLQAPGRKAMDVAAFLNGSVAPARFD